MRLRPKFLLIFTLSAILPLVAVAIYTRMQITRLGRNLSGMTRDRLVSDAKVSVMGDLRQMSEIRRFRRLTIETMLGLQVAEAETMLMMSGAAQRKAVFSDADFDREDPRIEDLAPSDMHFKLAADGSMKPMKISRKHNGFRPPPGKKLEEFSDTVGRLAGIGAALERIRDIAPELPYWQYIGFESGLHISYPGHGGYPKDYDPRQRRWYRAAIDAGGLAWLPPQIDASTRRITLTVSAPVHDAGGAVIGVAGMDIPLSALVGDYVGAQRWGREAHVELIDLGAPGTPPTVMASQSYDGYGTAWNDNVTLQPLTTDNKNELTKIADKLRAGEEVSLTIYQDAREYLWAAIPTWQRGVAMLVRIPYQAILEPAQQVQKEFEDVVAESTRAIAIALAGLSLLTGVLVIGAAERISSRIGAMSGAAKKVAAGELKLAVPEHGKDEIADLGRSLNSMIPQLKGRLELMHSLSMAMQVQQSLLPSGPPKLEGLDIAGNSIYCDQTGGDYYDFLSIAKLGPHQLVVAVGDVTGHGIAAAMLMATARALLRSRMEEADNLASVFTSINRHMVNDRAPDRFMTMMCLMVDTLKRQLQWVSAGHDPIICYEPPADRFYELAGVDIPLGIDREVEYHEMNREGWTPGTILVAGTDGIWEAANPAGEFYGKERLNEVIKANAAKSADEISAAITDSVREFRGSAPQADDVTLVVIRFIR